MKTSLYLDKELTGQLDKARCLVKEPPATVLRMALRFGLPMVLAQYEPKAAGDKKVADQKTRPASSAPLSRL